MNGLEVIVSWLTTHVKMHAKRRDTLAHLVFAAMRMRGLGVLALGRAMCSETSAKHQIKRVWRFLRNAAVECESVQAALFRQFAPREGRIVVLVDWTDLMPYTQLVLAFARDGRAVPFMSITVPKQGGEGSLVEAERQALERLASLCPPDREMVLVADRGFGNSRWMGEVAERGWYFVQRLPRSYHVEVEHYAGGLFDMRFRRRQRARDFGSGTIGETHPVQGRLVAQYSKDYDEPWYLATNLEETPPAEIVRYYQRRMWIEAMFRDWKNRQWGMGLDAVRLSAPERHDRLFIVLALAYIFLCACGAYAERTGLAQTLKANTRRDRVMTLLRIGLQLLMRKPPTSKQALRALQALPT